MTTSVSRRLNILLWNFHYRFACSLCNRDKKALPYVNVGDQNQPRQSIIKVRERRSTNQKEKVRRNKKDGL